MIGRTIDAHEELTADSFSGYYNKLNPDQKRAVDITDGPLLILAGPGTGKTELLSVRAANIIQSKKANPQNILIRILLFIHSLTLKH